MKKTFIFALSLALNAALVVHVVCPHGTPVSIVTEGSPAPSQGLSDSVRLVENAAPIIVTNAFQWSMVESTNYAIYRDNLRTIGCPEETIRDLIEDDLRATLV